jgi:hypothetical protein
MNFVADESCAAPVIRALRQAGHEVAAIAEVAPGATDDEVLERALNESGYSSRKTVILGIWFTGVGALQRA